jgi:hypothetical protein
MAMSEANPLSTRLLAPLWEAAALAIWRHGVHFIRTVVGGSPFKTFAGAEEACNTMLKHLAKQN